jgi:hypothetical protein
MKNKTFFISVKGLLIIILYLIVWQKGFTQNVAINNDGSSPDSSAILDIQSDSLGLLIPRMSTAEIIAIKSPAKGLMVYDSIDHAFKYYDGLVWSAITTVNSYNFYYADKDGDGYGYPFNVIYAPSPPPFYVANNSDCEDSGIGSENIYPGAIVPNGLIDANCQLQCDSGYSDCNGNLFDGCETDILTDNDNCSSCDQPCPTDANCINGQCVFPDGYPCDDGDPCTVNDVYNSGICQGTPKNCDDGNHCTTDSCDPATGNCVNTLTPGANCDDGNPCTVNDTCNASGQCEGTPINCDDGDPCTDDFCDGTGNCVNIFNPDNCP